MSDKREIKVIKRSDVPKVDPRFIESHELSLLSLLVIKYPERAKVFLSKLKASVNAGSVVE